VLAANFLGDILAEWRGCAESLTGPELGINGLGGYGSNEQQSIGSIVESRTYRAD